MLQPFIQKKRIIMLIKSFCRITNQSIVLDRARRPELEKLMMGNHVVEDLDRIFLFLKVDFPSYKNMDDYSKLGFITAELLMRHNGYDPSASKPDMGLFIYSRSGCLGADYNLVRVMEGLHADDQAYKRSIPNAVCSDIALRHNIQGEMEIFLSDGFIYEQFFRTCFGTLETEPSLNTLLAGYLECYGGYASSLLCLLTRSPEHPPMDYDLREERFCIDLLRIY